MVELQVKLINRSFMEADPCMRQQTDHQFIRWNSRELDLSSSFQCHKIINKSNWTQTQPKEPQCHHITIFHWLKLWFRTSSTENKSNENLQHVFVTIPTVTETEQRRTLVTSKLVYSSRYSTGFNWSSVFEFIKNYLRWLPPTQSALGAKCVCPINHFIVIPFKKRDT